MEQKACPNNCDRNPHPCECTNVTCARHGKCCECVAAHKSRGGVPNCMKDLAKK